MSFSRLIVFQLPLNSFRITNHRYKQCVNRWVWLCFSKIYLHKQVIGQILAADCSLATLELGFWLIEIEEMETYYNAISVCVCVCVWICVIVSISFIFEDTAMRWNYKGSSEKHFHGLLILTFIYPKALICQLLQVIIHIFFVYHLIPRIVLFQKLLVFSLLISYVSSNLSVIKIILLEYFYRQWSVLSGLLLFIKWLV